MAKSIKSLRRSFNLIKKNYDALLKKNENDVTAEDVRIISTSLMNLNDSFNLYAGNHPKTKVAHDLRKEIWDIYSNIRERFDNKDTFTVGKVTDVLGRASKNQKEYENTIKNLYGFSPKDVPLHMAEDKTSLADIFSSVQNFGSILDLRFSKYENKIKNLMSEIIEQKKELSNIKNFLSGFSNEVFLKRFSPRNCVKQSSKFSALSNPTLEDNDNTLLDEIVTNTETMKDAE